MKVLRICVILLLMAGISIAEDLPKSPRQIYNDNRRIENEGGIHTTRPPIQIKGKKKIYIRECYSETGEKIACPETEPEDQDPTERTYME